MPHLTVVQLGICCDYRRDLYARERQRESAFVVPLGKGCHSAIGGGTFPGWGAPASLPSLGGDRSHTWLCYFVLVALGPRL